MESDPGPSRHALPSPVLTAAVPGGLGPHLGREDAARQNGHPTPPPLPPRVHPQPAPDARPTRAYLEANPGRMRGKGAAGGGAFKVLQWPAPQAQVAAGTAACKTYGAGAWGER